MHRDHGRRVEHFGKTYVWRWDPRRGVIFLRPEPEPLDDRLRGLVRDLMLFGGIDEETAWRHVWPALPLEKISEESLRIR